MQNPLLVKSDLPPFSKIQASDVVPAIRQILEQNRADLDEALERCDKQPSWEALVTRLDAINDRLSQSFSPVSHLNSVCSTDELRDAYNEILPELSRYWTEMGQHEPMFNSYRQLSNSTLSEGFTSAQKKVLENNLRDFKLSGIDLPPEKKQRYGEIQEQLSELTNKFSENVMDATDHWNKQITNLNDLKGLPDSAIAAAKQAAKNKGLEGWLISLDFPSYFAVITYADDQALRHEVYQAYVTRASEVGPDGGKWDNSPLMIKILDLRLELAQLLGFNSFADYSLATKMAESPEQVIDFLEDLAKKSRAQAMEERDELVAFAQELGLETLNSWDVSYVSEKLKQARYAVSQEQLRPYFPMPRVLNGMFSVAQRLFGIEIKELSEFDSWHKDARFFEIYRDGEHISSFYLDPFAREKKRGGAWMDVCRTRLEREDGSVQLPVAYLVCNFNPPVGDDPALLTHNEVTTLFHEFGHGLHHMLTKIVYADISGISGVPWDAVELPSQFMENWCWEPEALSLISSHYQTGEALPLEMLEKMLAAKNFQSALMMVRQLEFSLFDFKLHHQYQPKVTDVQTLLNEVRQQVAVLPPPEFNRFQHSFTHIFAGGYAAGYYSYKWAEVLSADAFSRFEEDGIFNAETGTEFREKILEMGGSEEPMVLFKSFRGREPSVDALLKHSGIR